MSIFQRQHYEAIAECCGYISTVKGREMVVESMIKLFERDNPNFQPDRFRERVKQYAEGIIMR